MAPKSAKTAAILMFAATLVGGAAMAQEAIPTARGALAPPPGAAPSTTPTEISDARRYDDRGPVGPCGGVAKVDDAGVVHPDRAPHGEVWGGVGTHGYREAGAVVCAPIGDHAAVTIAVDAGQIDYGRRR